MINSSSWLIYGTSKATRGITTAQNLKGTSKNTKLSIFWNQTNLFEKIWFLTFFVAGIACLVFLPFSFTMVFAVISLYFYMIAGNLIAHGVAAGFFVSIVSMLIYVVICGFQGVYGEVIINVALYLPMDVVTLVKWKKSIEKQEKSVSVTKFERLDWLFYLAFVGFVGAGAGFFLKGVLSQKFAFLNSFMIVLCIAGNLVRNKAQKQVWLFYIFANIIGIIMWLSISTDDGLSTLPYVFSNFAALTNGFNGMFHWEKLYKRSKLPEGEYLSKRGQKINTIIKLRLQMKNLKWKNGTGERWQTRVKQKQEKNHKITKTGKN